MSKSTRTPKSVTRRSSVRDRATRIAAIAAPGIIAIQSAALAGPDQVASPTATQIFAVPLLGPAELAAAGAAVATLGAYRLMKSRKSRGEPRAGKR